MLERYDKTNDVRRNTGPRRIAPKVSLTAKGIMYLNAELTRRVGGLRYAQFRMDTEAEPPYLQIKFVAPGEDYDRRFGESKGGRGSIMLSCGIKSVCAYWCISLAKTRRFAAVWDPARRTVTVRFKEVER